MMGGEGGGGAGGGGKGGGGGEDDGGGGWGERTGGDKRHGEGSGGFSYSWDVLRYPHLSLK